MVRKTAEIFPMIPNIKYITPVVIKTSLLDTCMERSYRFFFSFFTIKKVLILMIVSVGNFVFINSLLINIKKKNLKRFLFILLYAFNIHISMIWYMYIAIYITKLLSLLPTRKEWMLRYHFHSYHSFISKWKVKFVRTFIILKWYVENEIIPIFEIVIGYTF